MSLADALTCSNSRQCKAPRHPMNQLTELLGRIQAGDTQARDALFAAAYSELHRLAHARLRDEGATRCWTRPAWYTSPTYDSCVPGIFVPKTAGRFFPTPHK